MSRPVSALIGAVALAWAVPAASQPVKMRVADVYPVAHTVPTTTIRVFMDEVKKRLGEKIEFEYYPAEQIGKGKDLLNLTRSGVVDIGLIVPSYISDKLPLSAVAELPGAYSSSCQGTLATHRLTVGEGALARNEFGPNGVRVLITHTFAPFQAVSSRPVENLKGFEGQKLRTLGLVTDLTIKKMGAVPIRISAPEINEAMGRGTIDGGLMGIATVASYDLGRYLKAVTQGENFGGALVTYAISDANWRKLAPEVQAALTEAGEIATRNGREQADKALDAQYEKLRAAKVPILRFSAEDRKLFDAATADVGREWAETLDRRGRPASEVLKAFRTATPTN